jgi:hypothetical protein
MKNSGMVARNDIPAIESKVCGSASWEENEMPIIKEMVAAVSRLLESMDVNLFTEARR